MNSQEMPSTRSGESTAPLVRSAPSRSRWLRRAPVLLLLLAAAALLVWQARRYWPITVDDAAISFTYARHLASGEGLVLGPGGERIEAFSDPAWVGLLAVLNLLGLPLEQGAKVLGLLFSLAALGLLVPLAAQLRAGRSSRPGAAPGATPGELLVDPLPAAAALAASCSVAFALWSVAGLESGLHAFLLLLACWRLLVEDRRPAVFPASALALLGLLLTRPEAPLFLALAAGFKLLRLLQASFGQGPDTARWRPAVRWMLLLAVPALLLLLARRLYFDAWLPNSFYIKQITFAFDPWAPLHLDGPGWRYLGGFVERNMLWPVLALLPFGLLCAGRARVAWLLGLALLLGGVYFVLYSGGDWMAEHRFCAPLVPLLLLLAGAGPAALAGRAERIASVIQRPRLALLLRWAAALLLLAAAAPQLQRLLPAAPPVTAARFTTFDEVRARGEAFAELARRLEVEDASLLDPDLGGTSFTGGLRLYDLFGLGDRMLSRYRWQAPLVREYLLTELRPTFVHLHGAWLSAYYLQEYPEVSLLFARLPERLGAGQPKLGGVNLIRRSLFASPWVPLAPVEEIAFPEAELRLVGADLGPGAVAPGSAPAIRLTFLVAAPPPQEPEAILRLAPLDEEGGTAGRRQRALLAEVPVGRGLFPPGQWLAGERIELRLPLPIPAEASGRHRLQLGLRSMRGGRLLQAADGRQLVPLGELEVGHDAARADQRQLEDALREALAAGRLESARPALQRLEDYLGADHAVVRRACAAVAAALLTRMLLFAAADDLETAARTLQTATALGCTPPEAAPLLAGLADRLRRQGTTALAEGDADGAFVLLRHALDLEPAVARTRTLLEEARGRRSAAAAPFLELQARRAGLAYGEEPSAEQRVAVLQALAETGGSLDAQMTDFCPQHSCGVALPPAERVLLAQAYRRQGELAAALALLGEDERLPLPGALLRHDVLALLGQQPRPGEVAELLERLPGRMDVPAGPDLRLRGFHWWVDRDERVVLQPFFHRRGARVASSRGLVRVEARPRHGVLGGGEVRQVRDTFFPGGRIFALELPIRLPAGHWQLRLGLPARELAAVEATVELGEVTVALPNLTFEGGNIAGWQAEGEAFSGLVPTGEAAAGQQLVTGWRGRFFLNGYVRGDRPQGRLTSSPFALDRPVLTFLVGGGRLPGQLGVLLHVQGMQGAVREATGPGSERMERVSWDVSPWLGRQARIELLDRASGSWGHLLFDDVQLLPALSTGQGVPPAGEVQGGGGEVPAR